MKNLIICFMLGIICSYVQAKPTTFTCDIEELPGEGQIIFKVMNMDVGEPELDFIGADPYGDGPEAVAVTGDNPQIIHLVDTLNSQGGDANYSLRNNFYLFGDSAGIDLVYLYLYKNSRYKHGYIQYRSTQNTRLGFYSKISCTLK